MDGESERREQDGLEPGGKIPKAQDSLEPGTKIPKAVVNVEPGYGHPSIKAEGAEPDPGINHPQTQVEDEAIISDDTEEPGWKLPKASTEPGLRLPPK